MPVPPTIDIHAHFYPESYLNLLAQEGEALGIRVRQGPRGVVFEMRDGMLGPIEPAFTSVARKLAIMMPPVSVCHQLS